RVRGGGNIKVAARRDPAAGRSVPHGLRRGVSGPHASVAVSPRAARSALRGGGARVVVGTPQGGRSSGGGIHPKQPAVLRLPGLLERDDTGEKAELPAVRPGLSPPSTRRALRSVAPAGGKPQAGRRWSFRFGGRDRQGTSFREDMYTHATLAAVLEARCSQRKARVRHRKQPRRHRQGLTLSSSSSSSSSLAHRS
ncbi:unnamed protein product, partial [Ectocarpus sp. 12 AP-2014]